MSNTTSETTSEAGISSVAAIVAVSVAAGLCSLLTVFGNFVVILAFITNRSLRNFSNYLILNLAISDFIIGLFSMNIFAIYNVSGSWTMGKGMCNAWLTVDYVVSNTSVMNLLVICIDRYLAITSPVKYRQRCTPNAAALVICIAWAISFVLWAPAILLWEIISPGSEPVSQGSCSIPFMESSTAVTVITAVGAFYLPAAAMIALYWRVIVKIERQTSSVSAIICRATTAITTRYARPWIAEQADDGKVKETAGTGGKNLNGEHQANKNAHAAGGPPVDKTVIGKPDADSIANLLRRASSRYQTKASLEVQDANKRDSGFDKCSSTHLLKKEDTKSSSNPELSESPHSVTRSEEDSLTLTRNEKSPGVVLSPKISTNQKTRSQRYAKLKKHSSNMSFLHKQNDNNNRLNREKRATTLLKSILICFIFLWLPYNVIVIVSGICGSESISSFMWTLSYWLCYLNSTANPFCYGYCNENFQRTFKALITSKWWTPTGRRRMRCQVSGRSSIRAV